jgi:hypothetical protein
MKMREPSVSALSSSISASARTISSIRWNGAGVPGRAGSTPFSMSSLLLNAESPR